MKTGIYEIYQFLKFNHEISQIKKLPKSLRSFRYKRLIEITPKNILNLRSHFRKGTLLTNNRGSHA